MILNPEAQLTHVNITKYLYDQPGMNTFVTILNLNTIAAVVEHFIVVRTTAGFSLWKPKTIREL